MAHPDPDALFILRLRADLIAFHQRLVQPPKSLIDDGAFKIELARADASLGPTQVLG
jgi:hypothetical protein